MSRIPVLIDTDGQMDSLWGMILAKRSVAISSQCGENMVNCTA